MNQPATIAVLNRMLNVLCRSLPMYLKDAQPWGRPERPEVKQALENLADDQETYARRVAEEIVERGGRPDPGRFPIEFAALNDLAIEYLLRSITQRQRRDAEALEQCVADLDGEPLLCALAEETLGNARGHLEILEPLSEEG